jgi:hypothetical protein
MSLLWADFPSGFQGLYSSDEALMLNGRYAEVANADLLDDPDPNITGRVLSLNGGFLASGVLRTVLLTSALTVGMSMRVWMSGLPTDTGVLPNPVVLRNVSNTDLFSLRIETDGRVSAYRGNGESGTLLGTSTSPAFVSNAWQHLEAKVFLDDAVGTVEVRVEGIPVLELSDIDTLNSTGPCTQVVSRSNHTSSSFFKEYFIKDYLLWDTAGSINNDFFGSVSVYPLLTDADISLNWTPSTGTTGWDILDNIPPTDSIYISAPDPAPAAAVMSLTDLPADVTSVRGLISIVRAEKTDGGDGNLQVSLTSGANTDAGADRPMTTAFTYWSDISEINPGTGVFWTPTEVDAMDIEFDRTV